MHMLACVYMRSRIQFPEKVTNVHQNVGEINSCG